MLVTADLEHPHDVFGSECVEWSQLERGPFRGSVRSIELPTVRVFREAFSLGIRRRGTLDPGTSMVALLEDKNTCARWFGIAVTEDDMALTGASFNLNTMGAGAMYSVILDTKRPPTGRQDDAGFLAGLTRGRGDFRLARNPRDVAHLRAYMRRIFSLAGQFPSALIRPALREIAERDLLDLLAITVEGQDVEVRPSHNRRINAVRAAETYMLEHIDEPISLQQLSAISGLTPGSLRNAFEAVIGLTPIAYLKRHRLSGVRRDLRRANRKHTRIIDVALDWGFTHMGHFAADYQEMFAERPSQTLARP